MPNQSAQAEIFETEHRLTRDNTKFALHFTNNGANTVQKVSHAAQSLGQVLRHGERAAVADFAEGEVEAQGAEPRRYLALQRSKRAVFCWKLETGG